MRPANTTDKPMVSASPYVPQAPGWWGSKIEGAGVADAGFAGFAAFDAADAEEFFAVLLQVGFHGLHFFRRDDENHSHAHIEGLQQFADVDLPEFGKIPEDRQHGPGCQVNFRFHATGQDARQISWDAAAGDVRERGNPAARDDTLQSRRIAEMWFQQLRADFISNVGDVGIRL